jgi:hypothetical protein
MRLRRIPLVNRKRIRVVVGVGVAVWWFGVGAAGAGTIRGTVRLTGPVVETRKVSVTADQNVCGKEKDLDELRGQSLLHRHQRPGRVPHRSGPPGQHVLQLWQELLGTTTRNVSVADQGVRTVVVEMSRR